MSGQRNRNRSIPNNSRNRNTRLMPGVTFPVELTPDQREGFTQVLFFYLEQIPENERLAIVEKMSPQGLQQIIQRLIPTINRPRSLSKNLRTKYAFDAIPKLDHYLLSEFVSPIFNSLNDYFPREVIDEPTSEQFDELIHQLRTLWSRAAVNSAIAHLSLAPLPAQEFAVEGIQSLLEIHQSDSEDNLREIEFPNESLSRLDSIDSINSQQSTYETQNHSENVVEDVPSAPDVDASTTESLSDSALALDVNLEEDLDDIEPHPYEPVHTKVELPNIDEHIYTPLGRLLIFQALASADERQVGALSREDYVGMLEELTSLNHAHMPTWFQVGFSSALGLVESDYLLQSASINSERKQWRLWGFLKGLVRTENPEEIRRLCAYDWELLREMLMSGKAQDILNDISREIIYVNSDHAEAILTPTQHNSVRTFEHEHELISMLDTESVKMLRNGNASLAATTLKIAERRLANLLRKQDITGHQIHLLQHLLVRIQIGKAACARISEDFESSTEILKSIDSALLATLDPRTRARVQIQLILSQSKTKRIEDILLPRNKSDRTSFVKTFKSFAEKIDHVLQTDSENSDAIYLKAGLAVAEEEASKATNLLGRARMRFEGRDDRQYLIPQLRLQQVLQSIASDGISTVSEGIDALISNPFDWRLQKDEFKQVLLAGFEFAPNNLAGLLKWTVETNIGVTSNLEIDDLKNALEFSPESFNEIVQITSKLEKKNRRMEMLINLLQHGLNRQNHVDIDETLSHIDDERDRQSNSLQKSWAEFCLNNYDFRDYLGESDANLMAIASASYTTDDRFKEDALIRVLDAMLPIKTFEEEANFNQILSQLKELNPELALEYDTDPQRNVPTTYSGWTKSEAAQEATSTAPVKILFIGGNPERQREINENVKSAVAQEFGQNVEIEFLLPGWKSNWNSTIDSVKSKSPKVDAVILMPLVRTNFGRTLRRILNEAHIPRISCTAEGQTASMRAIQEAAAVATRLRS